MTVQHDPERQRFVIPLADGEAALLYTIFGDDMLDLRHTEVPRSARRQGVGDALVRAALDYAREHDFHLIVTCPYVQRWLRKHPEERPAGTVDRSTAT
jgi:predicted GNAT family acetyltransferase